MNSKTKLVSLVHVSNALGTILPTQEIAEAAQRVSHTHAAPVFIGLAVSQLFSSCDCNLSVVCNAIYEAAPLCLPFSVLITPFLSQCCCTHKHCQSLLGITACSAVLKQNLLERLTHHVQVGAKVLFDCCQSVPCRPTDVQQLGADWIVGAGHKMCGPTGSAFLWGKYVFCLYCTTGTLPAIQTLSGEWSI